MKRRLLPFVATGVLMVASWAIVAMACDHEKNTTAQAAAMKGGKGGTCSAAAAAQCTPEQMAQCKAHGMKAGAASTAGATCGAKHSSAMAAGAMCGSKNTSAMAAGANCGAKNTAVTASNGGCAGMLGAVFASSTGAPSSHCAGKSATAGSATCSHGTSAMAAGAGCNSHSNTQTAMEHGACDACADMSSCEDQLRTIGTQVRAVPLKNGVMFVYTASAQSGVRAVQAAMTRRSDRLTAITASGDKASLCPECKTLRGAVASGKLTREMVNIEGGCLTLMTSNDPAMVAKLKAMAGTSPARTKS